MDENKKKSYPENAEKEIVFSKMVKAGKRIYYLDVKKNRKEDLYLAITESKKIVSGAGEDVQVSFEKHKIFLYHEDLDKFDAAFREVLAFIRGEESGQAGTSDEEAASEPLLSESQNIEIDIDF